MNAGAKFRSVATYLPERILTNAELTQLGYELDTDEPFFKGVQQRHWASKEETSVFMGSQAAKKLLDAESIDPKEIDLIICSSIVGDVVLPQPACGIQNKIGAVNATAITLDTGCASFVSGVIYAASMIRSGMFKNIVLVSISNFAGRAQSQLREPSATIPGDGASAMLITSSENGECGLLGWWEKSLGQYHQMLSIKGIDSEGNPSDFWQPHEKIAFWFDRELIEPLKENARVLVPRAIKESLNKARMTINDVQLCFTHQPNEFLINHWRDSLNLDSVKHFNTLAIYGNLFQASIPISISQAMSEGKLGSGDLIVMGSFAFAGELAAGAVIKMS